MSTTFETSLGSRIRQARLNHDWSLRDLAGRIGRSRSWLSKVERGVEMPATETLRCIAAALDWTPTELDAAFGEMGQASDDVIAMIAERPDLNALVRRAFLHGGLIQDSQRRDQIGTRSPRA